MTRDRRLADGAAAVVSTGVSVPGYELLVPVGGPGDPPAAGAMCRVSDGAELRGVDAWRAATAATPDPVLLAAVAMTVLERGVAGRDPSRAGEAPAAPSLDGGVLTYWRRHEQLANQVRVSVVVATGAVTATLDTDLARPTGTVVERAPALLAAPTLPERLGAVRELAASDDPEARALLFAAARGNDAWKVRNEAVRQLGERPRPGAVEVLVGILAADAQLEVRATAATALGKLGAREAIPALEAAGGDPSPVVRAAALGAVTRLR